MIRQRWLVGPLVLGLTAGAIGAGGNQGAPDNNVPRPQQLQETQNLSAVRADAPDGFATVGGNVTGGIGGQEVTVTTGAELKKYADSVAPYVIYVSGKLALKGMEANVRSNKTIIGLGADAQLEGGGLYLYNASNVIIRNLTIKGSIEDGMGLLLAKNVWIDHCTFQDAKDEHLGIRRASDNITVSWCKFFYSSPAKHALACLLGSSDDETDNEGKLHVTFHHNWFGENVRERMPSVRFGTVHVYNNYYNAKGNVYCVRSRLSAQTRIENNYFEDVANPWEVYITNPAHVVGKVFAKDNLEINTVWGKTTTNSKNGITVMIVPGTDQVFTPPYAYMPEAAATVKNSVMNGAGAGKIDLKPTAVSRSAAP